MNKSVLFISNHKGFSKFNAPYMKWFKSQGWRVDNISPGVETDNFDNQFDVDIKRNPFNPKNIKAFFEIKKIINKNKYDIIHVHTPMGSVLGRLASIKTRQRGTYVIYTAHGFHFFKGAPFINWILYFTIEKVLGRLTDILVTINNEDYKISKKYKLSKKIYLINGVGVDLYKFYPVSIEDKMHLREKYNINSNDFVGIYIAQFINRKNHEFLIKSIPYIINKIPNFKLLLIGSGIRLKKTQDLVKKLNLEKNVQFLGSRSDIPDLCRMADIHISSSLQEGLAIGNIEAMACGCPLVISNIRGHIEVCKNGKNGFLFNNRLELIEAITILANDKNLFQEIKNNNIKDVEKFSLENSLQNMIEIYSECKN